MLGVQVLTAHVRVLGVAEVPSTVTLSPADATVSPNGTVLFTVTLDIPAPGPTIVASRLYHWDGSTFVTGCPAVGAAMVFKSIRVQLSVAQPDGRGSQTLEVVKRP